MKTKQPKTPREMGPYGRPVDNLPVKAGDTFHTLSGRITTPYPKQAHERFSSQWLIDNVVAEAEANGDEWNASIFRRIGIPAKTRGCLHTADRECLLGYLFEWQPPAIKSIFKPLV